MKNKIIIYVIVQFLLILCSIFVIPNVEGVLSIFTVLIVIVGNVLNLIFLLKANKKQLLKVRIKIYEHNNSFRTQNFKTSKCIICAGGFRI